MIDREALALELFSAPLREDGYGPEDIALMWGAAAFADRTKAAYEAADAKIAVSRHFPPEFIKKAAR